MYRDYENPYSLEAQLKRAKAKLEKAIEDGEDESYLESLSEDIQDLEARANYAWQDEEADIYGYDY